MTYKRTNKYGVYKRGGDDGMENASKKIVFFILLILFLLITSGCYQQKSELVHKDSKAEVEKNQELNEEKPIKQLQLDKSQFNRIAGWLNNDTIIYIKEDAARSEVYTYHLYNGKQELLFSIDEPINDVRVSPSHHRVLIQTAPLTYTANLYFLDLEGNMIYSTEVESSELEIAWNAINEDNLFITAFYEDWSYDVYHLNLATKTFDSVEMTQPFLKWFGKDVFLSQRWDQSNVHLFAPLVKSSLHDIQKENIVFEEIYQFDTFKDFLMTINVLEEDRDYAVYRFYNHAYEEIRRWQIPHLAQYSDWHVPFYDLLPSNASFLTFVPYTSGSIEHYDGNYQLIMYHLRTGKKTVIAEQLENEPISCSPNGKKCLYGFKLENLIQLKTKKINSIVTLSEDIV